MFEFFIEDLDAYAYRLGLPKCYALGMVIIYPATWAIGVYRFGNWVRKNVRIAILRNMVFFIYFILKRFTEILTGIEIADNAEIGKGLFIGHLGSVVIGHSSKIGANASFHQGVTIGGAGRGERHGSPTIGDNVYFGSGSKIIGKIYLGDNVLIGANAVVVKSAGDNAVLGGVPAKVISFKGSTDFIHYRKRN